MSSITEALFNANRFASTQTNLDGDDFIYTDTVTSGWIGGAEVDYLLLTGNASIALASVIAQSDKTFNFKLFEGAGYQEGTGAAIVPFRLNRNKTGKPLSLVDARKDPTISNFGTKVWEKNFLIGTSVLNQGFQAVGLPLGVLLLPNTAYVLQISNTGDGVQGTLEFDLRFTTLTGSINPPNPVSIIVEAQ